MTSQTEDWIQRLLVDTGALLEGHFQLSSGLHSAGYVQCARLLQAPQLARQVGQRLAQLLASFNPDSVLAPALGGLLIGHEVAAALEVPFRFTERVGDEMALRRGFHLQAGERLALVEDVVTTGRSSLEAIAVAHKHGARIVAAASILDRTGGNNPFAVPFRSLLALNLDSYPAESCPLCAAGEPLTKPGSRPPASGE